MCVKEGVYAKATRILFRPLACRSFALPHARVIGLRHRVDDAQHEVQNHDEHDTGEDIAKKTAFL